MNKFYASRIYSYNIFDERLPISRYWFTQTVKPLYWIHFVAYFLLDKSGFLTLYIAGLLSFFALSHNRIVYVYDNNIINIQSHQRI